MAQKCFTLFEPAPHLYALGNIEKRGCQQRTILQDANPAHLFSNKESIIPGVGNVGRFAESADEELETQISGRWSRAGGGCAAVAASHLDSQAGGADAIAAQIAATVSPAPAPMYPAGLSAREAKRLQTRERLMGAAASKATMSSTKSSIGHLLGAAGAVEAIFCVLAIRDQIAPPTINLDNPAVEPKLDLAPNKAVKRKIDIALSNSFGFGGTNASLVLGKVKG